MTAKKKDDAVVLTKVTHLVDETGARYRFQDGILANIATVPLSKGPRLSIGVSGAVFAIRVRKEKA